jgi:hypothetical protein
MLLQSTLKNGSYNKLHSYKHIINGFSVHTTPSQVGTLFPYPFQSFLFIFSDVCMHAYIVAWDVTPYKGKNVLGNVQ